MPIINKMSWGRRLAKEAIRVGKRVPKGDAFKTTRKKYAGMAKTFRKKAC
jgi:hypothetical protein